MLPTLEQVIIRVADTLNNGSLEAYVALPVRPRISLRRQTAHEMQVRISLVEIEYDS